MRCPEPMDKKKRASDIFLEAIEDSYVRASEVIPYEMILDVISEWYGSNWKRCRFSGRKVENIVMYLLYLQGGLGYDEITVIMKKNRWIVIRGIESIVSAFEKNKDLQNEILSIIEKLKSGIESI